MGRNEQELRNSCTRKIPGSRTDSGPLSKSLKDSGVGWEEREGVTEKIGGLKRPNGTQVADGEGVGSTKILRSAQRAERGFLYSSI